MKYGCQKSYVILRRDGTKNDQPQCHMSAISQPPGILVEEEARERVYEKEETEMSLDGRHLHHMRRFGDDESHHMVA